ncbi:MAG: GIY-YIG nuclease family protein [Gammaproteobacteria bacterium]|nr:GIY-YIG nuclease family protein [Gammaproteobacteria bacterium]
MDCADDFLLEWHHETMVDGPPTNPSDVPGVYALAIAKRLGGPTTKHVVTPFYVGRTSGLRGRWSDHRRDWFTNPGPKYTIPTSADSFLSDPVAAINNGDLAKRLPDRKSIMAAVHQKTWFCYAECGGPRLGEIETMLQEAVKDLWRITAQGEIGDSGYRVMPRPGLCVRNALSNDLAGLLPARIKWVGAAVLS